MNEILRFEYHKGSREIFPCHPFVRSWLFVDGEEDEATLAYSLAVVAEKNGLDVNNLYHLFPAILRMLRSDIAWAGQKDLIQDSAGGDDGN
jgi:hypothetical protein